MNSLKRAIGLTLLLCLIIPAVGTYAWLQLQKSMVRKDVKERLIAGMKKEELVLLKFTVRQTETKLQWEHAREFEYNDEMYDVVETEIRGDSVFYWCWWDRKESGLDRRLEDLIAQEIAHNPKHRETQANQDFSSLLYILKPVDVKTPAFHGQLIISQPRHTLFSVHPSPPVPPPERI